MTAKRNQIVCPKCGCEYLPAELFIKDSFLGNPSNIIKGSKGEIISFYGSDMDLEADTFVCEKCGQAFKTEATITFKTTKVVDDFEDTF